MWILLMLGWKNTAYSVMLMRKKPSIITTYVTCTSHRLSSVLFQLKSHPQTPSSNLLKNWHLYSLVWRPQEIEHQPMQETLCSCNCECGKPSVRVLTPTFTNICAAHTYAYILSVTLHPNHPTGGARDECCSIYFRKRLLKQSIQSLLYTALCWMPLHGSWVPFCRHCPLFTCFKNIPTILLLFFIHDIIVCYTG